MKVLRFIILAAVELECTSLWDKVCFLSPTACDVAAAASQLERNRLHVDGGQMSFCPAREHQDEFLRPCASVAGPEFLLMLNSVRPYMTTTCT